MHKFGTVIALGLLAIGGITGCATLGGSGQQKVVYHINYNDEHLLKAALGNIKNHINAVCGDMDAAACKNKLDIKVVLHGDGVDMLKQANTNLDLQQKVINLKQQGVDFDVCNNTLKGRKINYKTDLFDVSDKDIVPSGVAELANLQQKGYVYIKP